MSSARVLVVDDEKSMRDLLAITLQRAGYEVVAMDTKPIPMSRGRIPAATKLAMMALSVAERLVRAEYELLVLARNPGLAATARS